MCNNNVMHHEIQIMQIFPVLQFKFIKVRDTKTISLFLEALYNNKKLSVSTLFDASYLQITNVNLFYSQLETFEIEYLLAFICQSYSFFLNFIKMKYLNSAKSKCFNF